MPSKNMQDLEKKLNSLKLEHRDLDETINTLATTSTFDQLRIQRLKKRKLTLKDEISKLQARVLPDIIA